MSLYVYIVPTPFLRRLRRSLASAWSFWIPPWDRRDHEEWSALRSPLLAWQVAWDIHQTMAADPQPPLPEYLQLAEDREMQSCGHFARQPEVPR